MNMNEITYGMTPQDKEIYFSHMEKRHKEEAEYVQAEKDRNAIYKEALIEDILKSNCNFSRDELIKKPLRVLERIACY